MYSASWKYQLVKKLIWTSKKAGLCLNFLVNGCQKQLRTSERFVQERCQMKCSRIERISSIGLLASNLSKVVIQHREMELVAPVSTGFSLMMSRFGSLINSRVYFRWQTKENTQMDHSSSSFSSPCIISMKSTQSLVG